MRGFCQDLAGSDIVALPNRRTVRIGHAGEKSAFSHVTYLLLG